MIFDDLERNYHGVALHTEDEYSFLNRSARPAADKVRRLLEDWAREYPAKERDTLKPSLGSRFHSTFFEMFIHTLLLRLGCTVEIHPEVNIDRRTRPDFRATFPTGEQVIIECVYPNDPATFSKSERARLDALYDGIGRIRSSSFVLQLNEVSGLEIRQPSIRRLRNFIESKLAGLDREQLQSEVDHGRSNSMPTWTYEDGEFSLEFSVWPKASASPTEVETLIASYPGESRLGGHGTTLRSVIAKKATRYGELGIPFVVAVNTGALLAPRRDDEMDSLFGYERAFLRGENMIPSKGNGVWLGRGGPQNTRVSAVIFSRVFPWNLPVAPICMYHNPFAAHPCLALPWQIDQAVAINAEMQWQARSSIGSLLNMPPDWPGKLFPIGEPDDSRNENTSDEGSG